MKVRLFHIIVFSCCAFLGAAQHSFHNVVNITTDDGLLHRWVYDLEEDDYGFIWIGTYEGLCRFDGTNVLPVVAGETPLRVRSLLRTGDTLWIGTFDGAATMDLTEGRISAFEVDSLLAEPLPEYCDDKAVRSLFQDRQAKVWMAPSCRGFVRLDPTTRQVDHFPLVRSTVIPKVYSLREQQSLLEIVQDGRRDTIFWGITAADLVKLNVHTGRMTRFRNDVENEELAFNLNRHYCLYAHGDGKVYLGSWYAGLSVFDPVTNRYFVPSLDPSYQWPFHLQKETLLGIFPKSAKELYLTFSSGLYLYSTEDHSVQCLQKNIAAPYHHQAYGVSFQDSEGRLWNCLNRNGIQLFDPLINQFDFFPVHELNPTGELFLPRDFVEDFYPGYLTLAGQYSDGLYHVNPATGHLFKTPAPESHMSGRKFFQSWGIARLSEEELIVSENRQLFHFKKGMTELAPYQLQPRQKYSSIVYIDQDRERRLWIGSTLEGLWSIDLSSREITDHTPRVNQSRVPVVFSDKKGNTWFCFDGGHGVVPAGKQAPTTFRYEQDSLRTLPGTESFCECPNGDVWLAAREDGLGLFSSDDPERGLVKKLILKDSSRQYHAYRVTCDQDNQLWVLGLHHLLKVDRESGIVIPYSSAYGLDKVSGLFSFLKSGKLLIGGREGIFIIDPEQLRTNTNAPKPYLIGLRTNKGDRGTLGSFLQQKSLELLHSENALTIEFAAVNLTLPQATQFQYQLQGLDESWNDPEKNRTVTYSNLGGGEYLFRLRAANNEGQWSEPYYELPIVVHAAWYETTAFFTILGLVLIGLIYGIYKYRVGEVRRKEQLRSDFELKIANIEMSALRAQMNPHFIFNCLNSIDRYIIRNDTQKASEYLNSFGRLIRLILQNSRSNYVILKDELEALDLYIKLEQMRFHHSFDYEIDIAVGLNPENYEVPPMLIQPYVENAIWHGLNPKEDKGKVTVSIAKGAEVIRCTVEDNGIGREAARLINNAKKVKRQSMGMNITSERIEIINRLYKTNNQIEVIDLYREDGTAKGTRVVLNIPL